jgi:hypothetical protein
MSYLAAFIYLWGIVCMVTGMFDLWVDRATAYAFASCMFGACAAIGSWRGLRRPERSRKVEQR